MLREQIIGIFQKIGIGVLIFIGLYLVFKLFTLIRLYIMRVDNVLLYTGGLGSGKSLVSCRQSINLLRKNRIKVWLHNIFIKKDKWPKPMLYSNIPVRISRREWSISLSLSDLLGQTEIIPRSVVFLDEVGLFLNQFQTRGDDVDDLDLFMTLFRHYTLGGYLVINTQSVHKVNHKIRYNLDSSIHLRGFRRIPIIGLAWTHARTCYTGDEITCISNDAEDEEKLIFMLVHKRNRHYDTYCYSDLYNAVPPDQIEFYNDWKSGRLLSMSHKSK